MIQLKNKLMITIEYIGHYIDENTLMNKCILDTTFNVNYTIEYDYQITLILLYYS
jgi:hypothetical protein